MLKLSEKAVNKSKEAILVTGAARSGTTILGKILHSMINVEYSFEPPMLISLFSQINNIPSEAWKLLYETYLYEEFLINSIAGRSINTNKCDDSTIYNVKSTKEINSRLEKSWRKNELESIVNKYRIVYKIPNIIPFIVKFQKLEIVSTIIFIKRSPYEIINSLFNKHWFSDLMLKETSVLWPNTEYKDMMIPYWVKESDFDKWYKMSEIDRCAYYVIRQFKSSKELKNCIVVDYHNLLESPAEVVSSIARKLSLSFGAKTDQIISTVKPQGAKQNTEQISAISQNFRYELESL